MADKCLLEDGHKIVFLGDSITEAPNGYVSIVERMISTLAPDIRVTCINAGVGGNQVMDMLERIGDDVIMQDPDWICISVGINDVWYGLNGTSLEHFIDKYLELLNTLQSQTVAKLALFTTTVIGEDLKSEANHRLMEYNDYIRQVAKKRKMLLVPMNEAFYNAISRWRKTGEIDNKFTTDGVHMTEEGNYLMAVTLLKAWNVL